MSIGERIAFARRKANIKQETLAAELDVSFQAVSGWERDISIPDTLHLIKLADALQVSADWLLGRVDNAAPARESLFDEGHMYPYLKAKLQEAKLVQALYALELAREKHAGQLRKGVHRKPYIIHPLTMACHAWAMGVRDDDVISALLLHDVVEDTNTDIDELRVNERTREAVRLVSYNTYERMGSREQIKPEYYANIALNPLACLVKCIDRCNNLSCMYDGFTNQKKAEYVRSTEEYIVPLLEVIKRRSEWNSIAWLLKYQITALLEAYKALL